MTTKEKLEAEMRWGCYADVAKDVAKLETQLAAATGRATKAEADRDEARRFVEGLSLRAGCWSHGAEPDSFCPYCGCMGAVVVRAERAETLLADVWKAFEAMISPGAFPELRARVSELERVSA